MVLLLNTLAKGFVHSPSAGEAAMTHLLILMQVAGG